MGSIPVMHGVVLQLRRLWWRRGTAGALLAVAVLTTVAAAVGPLYARAAAESTLHDHLTSAQWRTGITESVEFDLGSPGSYPEWRGAVLQHGDVQRIRGYDRGIAEISSGGPIPITFPNGTGAVEGQVVWRQGDCRHLIIIRGHCPRGPGEALASARTVQPGYYNWHLGTELNAGPFTDPNTLDIVNSPSPTSRQLRIVGVYRPKNASDPYWFGRPYFGAHSGGGLGPDTVDSLLVAKSTMLSLHEPAFVELDYDFPLTADKLRLADVAAVSHAVRRVLALPGSEYAVVASSGLLRVLAAADRERQLISTGTLLVSLQLALLAWLVLFHLASDAIDARADEIAAAKLRGHSPLRTVLFTLGEPIALLLAAVPLGLLAAFGITHAFAATVLVPGVPVVVTAVPLVAAGVAFAGGLVAALLAGRAALTRSVLDQWRRTTRRPRGRGVTLVVDVGVAGAAVVAVLLLHSEQGSGAAGDSAALLAPGLLVAAVGIAGVRLLPVASRWVARRTRASRRIPAFLASRQVARRPVGLRLATLLAVAVGLATFAVAGETVATTNRDARAAAELSADRVASVQFASGLDPVLATHRADPNGTWAMAVATWLPDGGDPVNGTVLGVDASRLPAIGKPVSGGASMAQLATDIVGHAVPEMTFSAVRLRVHVSAANLTGNARPQLQVNLRTLTDPHLDVELGTIRDGSASYMATVPCAARCTLIGLTWDRPITAVTPMHGQITLTGIDVASRAGWRRLPLRFGQASDWRAAVPQGQATDRLAASPGGVRDDFANRNGGFGGIIYGSSASPIPAVATAGALADGVDPTRLHVMDATGTTATLDAAHATRLLPTVLDSGVLVDVRYLEAELPTFRSEATWRVWLARDAPPDALQRLQDAGLQVQDVHSEAQRISQLSRQGPALALLLLLACAVAGAVLAVGGTAVSISASSRRRSFEIAALHAVGVSRSALLRAAVLEQLLLLGTAVVLGVPTGLLAARLTMPVIPEFSDHTPVLLRFVPQWPASSAFVASLVVLLTLTALVGARVPIRQANPARLRETEG